jgi:hypothetical protein
MFIFRITQQDIEQQSSLGWNNLGDWAIVDCHEIVPVCKAGKPVYKYAPFAIAWSE